jgi:hypothetical protein
MAPLILQLGTRWRGVVSFTIPAAIPPGRNTGTHRTGGWVGSTAGLDGFREHEIYFPCLDPNPRIVQPIA